MPAGGIAKEWFIPGDGIDRAVISSDIQRYLGNDATVRPGVGNGREAGIRGYWVKAYRNLTTAMVDDLRESSRRWQVEQRRTGTRDPYQESDTFAAAGNGMPARHPGDSPLGPLDQRHGTAGRARPPQRHPDDHMMVDAPYNQPPSGRYQQDRYDEPMDFRPQNMPTGPRQDVRDPRGPYQDRDYAGQVPDPRYPPDQRYSDQRFPLERFPPDQRFQGRPEPDMRRGDYRDGPQYADRDGYREQGRPAYNGPDFGRPDAYNAGPPNAPYTGQQMNRPVDSGYNGQFGQPPPRPDRDPRMPPQSGQFGQDMRDTRDPRYAYPSPAQSTVDPRDQTPPQHNAYPSNVNPQFDQFGGRPGQPPMNPAFQGQPGPPSAMPGSMPGSMPGPMPGPMPGSMPGSMPGPMPGMMPGNAPRPPQGNLGQRPPPPPNALDSDPRDPRRRRLQ